MRRVLIAVASLLLFPLHASAEWQFKPFLGFTFGGGTTFVDLEDAAGKPNVSWGGDVVLLGDIFGIEGDFATAPGFFQSGDVHFLTGSAVTTLTANIIVTLPRSTTEYTLRPYLAAGGGLVRVRIDDAVGRGPLVNSNQAGFDIGGGATGFITKHVGLSWDLRYFRSVASEQQGGLNTDQPSVSFWRATMALALRY